VHETIEVSLDGANGGGCARAHEELVTSFFRHAKNGNVILGQKPQFSFIIVP